MSKRPFKMKGFSGFKNSPIKHQKEESLGKDAKSRIAKEHNRKHEYGEWDKDHNPIKQKSPMKNYQNPEQYKVNHCQ